MECVMTQIVTSPWSRHSRLGRFHATMANTAERDIAEAIRYMERMLAAKYLVTSILGGPINDQGPAFVEWNELTGEVRTLP